MLEAQLFHQKLISKTKNITNFALEKTKGAKKSLL